MSLLDNGPHTVTVTPMIETEDPFGSTVELGDPVEIPGVSVQPVEASEAESLGVQATTSYRVIGRSGWPGGVHSKVRIDVGPQAGRTFDQSGEARVYGMSRRTAHFDVLIVSGSSEVR